MNFQVGVEFDQHRFCLAVLEGLHGAGNDLVFDTVDIDLELGKRHFPTFPLPEGASDASSHLRELCEAAHIDGMNENQIWSRIKLPLSKPALPTLAIFGEALTALNEAVQTKSAHSPTDRAARPRVARSNLQHSNILETCICLPSTSISVTGVTRS